MDHLADRLDEAAASMTALSRELSRLTVAPAAFAAAVPAHAGPTVTGLTAASRDGSAAGGRPEFKPGGRPDSAAAPGFGAVSGPAGSGRHVASGAESAAGLGLPGRVGGALRDHWAAVLEARAHEASSAAARLAEMAGSVRAARRQYAETDEAVERRFTQEM